MYSLDESLEELAYIQEGAQLCACNDVRKPAEKNMLTPLYARVTVSENPKK